MAQPVLKLAILEEGLAHGLHLSGLAALLALLALLAALGGGQAPALRGGLAGRVLVLAGLDQALDPLDLFVVILHLLEGGRVELLIPGAVEDLFDLRVEALDLREHFRDRCHGGGSPNW